MNTVKVFVVVLVLALSACKKQDIQPVESTEAVNLCKDPRPEMCTRDYRPVCAYLSDGSRKEYSNGCTACSDGNVRSWVDGRCAQFSSGCAACSDSKVISWSAGECNE